MGLRPSFKWPWISPCLCQRLSCWRTRWLPGEPLGTDRANGSGLEHLRDSTGAITHGGARWRASGIHPFPGTSLIKDGTQGPAQLGALQAVSFALAPGHHLTPPARVYRTSAVCRQWSAIWSSQWQQQFLIQGHILLDEELWKSVANRHPDYKPQSHVSLPILKPRYEGSPRHFFAVPDFTESDRGTHFTLQNTQCRALEHSLRLSSPTKIRQHVSSGTVVAYLLQVQIHFNTTWHFQSAVKYQYFCFDLRVLTSFSFHTSLSPFACIWEGSKKAHELLPLVSPPCPPKNSDHTIRSI